jgi:hypothetical protein
MARGSGQEGGAEGDAQPRVLRVDPLMDVIDAHEVEYIVIGGFAVAAHGYVRATKDIDICPHPRKENLARLAAALKELQAGPIDLEEFEEGFELGPDYEGLQHGGNWTLATKHGRIDIMQTFRFEAVEDELGDYHNIAAHSVERTLRGRKHRFVGYQDLLKMKRATGRDVDQIDINSLKQARQEL